MKKISSGVVHKISSDLQKVLLSHPNALETWKEITPLARNEFLCWINDAKREETRVDRIKRTLNGLMNGKRRPCCWIGCIHRKDKAVSPSVQGILNKRARKSK